MQNMYRDYNLFIDFIINCFTHFFVFGLAFVVVFRSKKTRIRFRESSFPDDCVSPALISILRVALLLVAHLALGVGHGLALLAVAGLALLLLDRHAGVGAGLVARPTLRAGQRLLQRALK